MIGFVSETVSLKSFKLCMMIISVELYTFGDLCRIPGSHSDGGKIQLKILFLDKVLLLRLSPTLTQFH